MSSVGSLKRFLLRCPSDAPADCTKIHSVLVMGVTGSGKSTFLDACANFLLGNTEFDSGVRYKLVDEKERAAEEETESKTSEVHSYFLPDPENPGEYFQLIDSPGYADTASDGFKTEDANTRNIWAFLKQQDELSAVCLVMPASTTKLTATAKYVMGKVTEAFGKDAADNIFLLCTFADCARPKAIDVARANRMPFKRDFVLNNAALFKPPEDASRFTAMYWDMCVAGMRDFFGGVRCTSSFSLTTTRAVLDKREAIAAELSRLQDSVLENVTKADSIAVEMKFVEEHKAAINANKGYTTHRNERRMRKKDVLPGTYTTYCQLCKSTCHTLCKLENNPDKERCIAMGRDGSCKRCEGKCHWSQHVNVPFIAEYHQVQVPVVHKGLKAKYDSAVGLLSAAEVKLAELKKEAEDAERQLSEHYARVRALLAQLKLLGLTQINFSEAAYLRQLIKQENDAKEDGYRGRAALLEAHLKKCLDLEWQAGFHDAVAQTAALPVHAASDGTGARYVDIPVRLIYGIMFSISADIDAVTINGRRFGGDGGGPQRELEITPSAALVSLSFCRHENGVMARAAVSRKDGGPPHNYGRHDMGFDETTGDLSLGSEVRLRVSFTNDKVLTFQRVADE